MNRQVLWPVVVVILLTSLFVGTVGATLTETFGIAERVASAISAGGLAVMIGAVVVLFDQFDIGAYRTAGRNRLLIDSALLFGIGMFVAATVGITLDGVGAGGTTITAGWLVLELDELVLTTLALVCALSVVSYRNRRYFEPRGSS